MPAITAANPVAGGGGGGGGGASTPVWVTATATPAVVTTPVRSAVSEVPPTVTVTGADPVAEVGVTFISQDWFAETVHAHPVCVVTCTVAMPPPDGNDRLVGAAA